MTHDTEMEKKYKRASNAFLYVFLAWVKSEPNFPLFFAKVSYVAICAFWSNTYGIYLVNFELLIKKRTNYLIQFHTCCFYRCMAVLFCSYLMSNTSYAVLLQIHFCRNLQTFSGKIVFAETMLV